MNWGGSKLFNCKSRKYYNNSKSFY